MGQICGPSHTSAGCVASAGVGSVFTSPYPAAAAAAAAAATAAAAAAAATARSQAAAAAASAAAGIALTWADRISPALNVCPR